MTKPQSRRNTRSDKFALTLHPTGQHCKKIRGKLYYFGRDRAQAVGCANSSGRKPSGFGLSALKPGRKMKWEEGEEQGGWR